MTKDKKNKYKFLNGHIYLYNKDYYIKSTVFESPFFNIDNVKLDIRDKDILLQYYKKYRNNNSSNNNSRNNILYYGSEYCNINNKEYNLLVKKNLIN